MAAAEEEFSSSLSCCCLLLPLTLHSLFHFMDTWISLVPRCSELWLRAVWMCFAFLWQHTLVCDCHVDFPVVLYFNLKCFLYLLLSSPVFWWPSRLVPPNFANIQFSSFPRSLRKHLVRPELTNTIQHFTKQQLPCFLVNTISFFRPLFIALNPVFNVM